MAAVPEKSGAGAIPAAAILTVVLAVVCLGISCRAVAEELRWKPFVCEEGKFSVLMPGTPHRTATEVPTAAGIVGQNLYSYDQDGISLDAEYSNLPFLAAIFGGRNRIYNNVVKEFMEREHVASSSIEEFSLDAYRGRIMTYETADRFGKVWMLLISRRIYVLQASVPRDYPDKSLIDSFFKSFKPVYGVARELHE